MDSAHAISQLEAAFAHKARPTSGESDASRPRVGCFGNGVPEVLLAATGCRVLDVKAVPDAELGEWNEAIGRVIEPFLDDYTRLFLHRLANGRFDHLKAIVFGRQDAAALVAYQYALEYQRQSREARSFPELLLWNAEQGGTSAVRAFNRRQAEGLWARLAALGLEQPDDRALSEALVLYRKRQQALHELAARQADGELRLAGLEAFRWRNAGRYLEAETFQSLLHSALSGLEDRPARAGKRLGLVGTATDSEQLYRTLDEVGTLVVDLQPFGQVWPGPMPQDNNLDALLEAMATDPYCPRGRSSIAMIDALADACAEARCDVVIAQMDQNDDTFGWDLPSLRRALGDRGIPLVSLGFRDMRPDDDWCAQTRQRLTDELGELG